LIYFP
jgi:type II secretory pathway pseudopilin PulG